MGDLVRMKVVGCGGFVEPSELGSFHLAEIIWAKETYPIPLQD